MLRFIGLVLILAGLAVAGLGLAAITAPHERVVIDAPVASAPERAVVFVLPEALAPSEPRSGDAFTTASATTAGAGPIPLAHEVPRQARFGEPFDVTLSIDATGAQSATGALPGAGEIVEAQVELSGDVQASLTGGTAFDVESLSPADQTISPRVANVWRWTVTPLASGEQTLVIDVFMKTASGTLQPVGSFRDEVTVEVSTLRQAITFAQTANPLVVVLSGIGSVLGGAFTALRFFSKSAGRG